MTPPLYGLDIETDTANDGLDPAVAAIVAVAVASDEYGDVVFDGDERAILRSLDTHLADVPPGVIVTWNGSRFDLPFLADRARLTSVPVALEIVHDPRIVLHRPPLAGHPGAYRARWHAHDHLDAYRAFRSLAPVDESGSLKSVARAAGLAPVEVDTAMIHELDLPTMRRYVRSDAALARELARQRWEQFALHRDQLAALPGAVGAPLQS